MVMQFQTAHGLVADGIAGPATLGLIEALSGKS
jgi:murein L,D-transpeptidase YcbB/YkuD